MAPQSFITWFTGRYTVTSNKQGQLQATDGNHSYKAGKIADMWLALRNDIKGWEYASLQDVTAYFNENKPADEEKSVERLPPSVFVEHWLTGFAKEWEISPMGKRITWRRNGIPIDRDIEDLFTAIMCSVNDRQLKYREGEIKHALINHFNLIYHDGIVNLFKTIAHDQRYEPGLEVWLRKLYDWLKPSQSFEIFSVLMKHWGWQVKRKLLERDVKYHMWINFYGATGLGKTTAIKKICAPLEDVTSTTTISKIFDDTREVKRLTENYVLIFDELAVNSEDESGEKLSKDQLAMLKSILTGDCLEARVYQTQKQQKKKITFSCISSANEHLYDIIYDDKSMRRFFEFNCTAKASGDFKAIEPVLAHPEFFWKGIDEDREEGYYQKDSELGLEIDAIQAKYYPTTSSVFNWKEETSARPGNRPAAKAYRYYRNYCVNCGYKPKSMLRFIDDLRHALPEAVTGNTITIDFSVTDLCRKENARGGDEDDSIEELNDLMKPASMTGGILCKSC